MARGFLSHVVGNIPQQQQQSPEAHFSRHRKPMQVTPSSSRRWRLCLENGQCPHQTSLFTDIPHQHRRISPQHHPPRLLLRFLFNCLNWLLVSNWSREIVEHLVWVWNFCYRPRIIFFMVGLMLRVLANWITISLSIIMVLLVAFVFGLMNKVFANWLF